MKAITFPASGQVTLCDLADPEPAPNEVLIKVRSSGMCHTDIDVMHARYGTGAFPVVPGHEYAGVVVQTGSEVSGFAVGDHVVVDPNLSCGECRACRRGNHNLCATLGAYGVTRNGGFAEYSAVDMRNLHLIGDLPFEQAALAEPMGCVLNGVGALAPKPQDEALIVGAGPIGLLLAIALRTKGLTRITLADIDHSRLDLARGFGFDAVESGGDPMRALRREMDICVDATGRPDVAASLVDYSADGGSVLFFGVCPPDAKISISPFELFRRQLRLAGTHSLNRNIPEAISAIRSFGAGIAGVVSHKMTLAEMAEVMASRAPAGSLKIQAQLS
ncbi:zinc-dependent alcohol dehydrogenase family protein [Paracoccus aurantiacus]|uniref:Zinc-dependent alcohol dehydrogenase family protein n=1 Tax=Paracoccus aurantiacus TaxID=2599412 RepID=A0A5C6S1G8_9RHOB|nr:zinc-dependent alcohol dehydrogenase family protein [Paracoccus aurantiacus]TXB68254.1 zinc-dependent alcohol dehydrogenase family protein [Paracoccus aurantiacus]